VNPITEITDQHLAYWSDHPSRLVTFTAPSDPPGCVPCNAIVTYVVEDGRGFDVVRVPWQPDAADVVELLAGGTIWLSTWGGLPAHMLEVQTPATGDVDYVARCRVCGCTDNEACPGGCHWVPEPEPAPPLWENARVPGPWAIVEIMGHKVRAGSIADAHIGGATLLRIQHPSVADHDKTGPLTECYGPAALFSVRPCSRDEATDWAERRWRTSRPTPTFGEIRALDAADIDDDTYDDSYDDVDHSEPSC
jgi:hypothetical protein